MTYKNQPGPVPRRLSFPALILARDMHFRYRVALLPTLQTLFLLICTAVT